MLTNLRLRKIRCFQYKINKTQRIEKKVIQFFFKTTKTIIFIDTNKTQTKFQGLPSYNKSKFITDQCKDIQI